LRYLRRHLHTTPSEMLELKFHCCMPMFIARQWIRHRAACLAGDARLAFDLPGAQKRGGRQYHSVSIADFHRMWHQGTEHPFAKKKPAYLERLELDREYTIPELARLVDRREETLRNYVRDGALDARRTTATHPHAPTIFVLGSAWKSLRYARTRCQGRHAASPSRHASALVQRRERRDHPHERRQRWESGVKPVSE